jgi:RNA polymerase sigma-70 factor (ECF subfamily)
MGVLGPHLLWWGRAAARTAAVTAEQNPLPPGTSPRAVRLLRSAMPAPAATTPGGRPASDGEIDPVRAVWAAAQRGDLTAFGQLVAGHTDRVMRVMISMLHCDRATAEDLCQEVFLRVHRGLPEFDGGVRFVVWLHTIARNVAIGEYRRRRAQKRGRPTASLDAPVPGTDDCYVTPVGREVDPGQQAQQREFAQRVRACVAQLPDEFREPVVLRDLEDLSYEEIAAVLGVPAGTVRSRIHRGRCLLQQMLQEFAP